MTKQTRRERSADHRETRYLDRLKAAETEGQRLWALCSWLVSEARHAKRLEEVTTAVRELVDRLRQGKPLTDPAGEPAAPTLAAPAPGPVLTPAPTAVAVSAPDDRPWWEITRANNPSRDDRTEHVA